jgi:streptomycin 6-kinase
VAQALPQRFVAAISGAWPAEGPAFLARLPDLIREYETRWAIQLLAPFPLSYNYVAPAVTADGAEVVLKLGVPNPELTAEIEALRLYDGRGAVRLLHAEPERGALLLERVRPGESLAALPDDDAATLIAAEKMAQLWRPLPADHPFPDLRSWTRSLTQATEGPRAAGPLPPALLERAKAALRELLTAPEETVLLHGDFHHFNVLRTEREPPEQVPWLVIDPKGVAAERGFEIGPLLYNPYPDLSALPDLARVTARRLDILSERLELDRERLVVCAFVGAMLSACWSVQEGDAMLPGTVALGEVLARWL